MHSALSSVFTNFVLHTPRILSVCLSICLSRELDNQPAISVHQSIICSCNSSAWVPNKLLIKNNSVLVYELLETNLYSLWLSSCVGIVKTAYDFQHIMKQTCRCSGTWVWGGKYLAHIIHLHPPVPMASIAN